MAWRRGGQSTRIWQRQWWRLGLLLVALFLGHDVLMATGAQARPPADHPGHQAALAHLSGDDPVFMLLDGRESRHADGCGVGIVAIPRSDDETGRAHIHATVALLASIAGVSPRVPAATLGWDEPHWPPGTLRALFQAYRI
jgi:hypothetical protein